jgi:hypothetical protein
MYWIISHWSSVLAVRSAEELVAFALPIAFMSSTCMCFHSSARVQTDVRSSPALPAALARVLAGQWRSSETLFLGCVSALPHVNLSASTLKRHLVHRQLHQVDTATVIGFQSFDRQRVGNRIGIKPLPAVCHDNGHSISQRTSTANPNQLVGVHPIAVNDCIAQSFPKCQFNGALISGNAARSFDQSHQPVCHRRDGFDFTRHPGLDLE